MDWYFIVLICIGSLLIWLLLSSIFYKRFFKRLYDMILSLLVLIVLSPLLVILTIVGAMAMKGNPFFVQERPGKIDKKTNKERIFKLIKFRTMTCEKDKDGNLLPDEKRLTKYGMFLRNTSIDELPELINILIGDMSIVGPRPQLIKDMIFMNNDQRKRHLVRQGLTGLAQINGRNNISWEQKFEFDLKYIDNITFYGDCNIIIKTILKVFKQEDINRVGTVSDMDYGDYLLKQGKITLEYYKEILLNIDNIYQGCNYE